MFKSIVVGTDGSETATRAVEVAAELAGAEDGAVLHIVSVTKPVSAAAVGLSQIAPAGAGVVQGQWQDDAVRDLNEQLKRVADKIGGAVPSIETYARIGAPADVLCELARQRHADLIVVGNRGMKGGRRLLGSVPNDVSHHAPCSVLIVQTVQ
jgi:nucleotide-binding universal stress UspA family protein